MNYDSFEIVDFRSNFYYNNFVPLVQKTERPRDHLQDITTYFTNICILYDFCSFDDSTLYLLSPLSQSLFSLNGPCCNSVSLPTREYKQIVDNTPFKNGTRLHSRRLTFSRQVQNCSLPTRSWNAHFTRAYLEEKAVPSAKMYRTS